MGLIAKLLRWSVFMAGGLGFTCLAQPAPILSGEYATQGAWGTLKIQERSGIGSGFLLSTITSRGHLCQLEGAIKDGIAQLETDPGQPACAVIFEHKGKSIEVSTQTPQACRQFCGDNAYFEGVYVKIPPGCDEATVKRKREAFQDLYDRKKYSSARAVLEPVLKRCQVTLPQAEEYMIRNDLAVTFHKLGNRAACRRLLEPMARFAGEYDTEGPTPNLDWMRQVARATNTNLELCAPR